MRTNCQVSIISLLIFLFIQLDSISQDKEPIAAYMQDSLWHVIASDGSELFEPKKLIDIAGFSEGMIRVRLSDNGMKKWGFMNLSGELVINPECDMLQDFHNGMAMVVKYLDSTGFNRLYGFIDKAGRQVVGFDYIDATEFSEALAYVMNKEKRGFIDPNGDFVIGIENLVGYSFSEGIAAVTNKDIQTGYINTQAEFVIEPYFDEPTKCSEGLIRVGKDGFWGYLDKSGKEVIPLKYEDAKDFSEGMAFVGKSLNILRSDWGLINRQDSLLTQFIFENVRDFSEGLAAVQIGKKWGFIDKNGNFVIQPSFTHVTSFKNGLAWASDKDNNIRGFIDREGNFIIKIPNAKFYIDLRFNESTF